MFEVGERVICIRNYGFEKIIKIGCVYVVDSAYSHGAIILRGIDNYNFAKSRFISLKQFLKETDY